MIFNVQAVVYKLSDGALSLSLALFLQIRREVISVLLISSQSGKCGKLQLLIKACLGNES